MSANDLKYSLRKSQFPYRTREALSRVEQLCTNTGAGQAPSTPQVELAMEIMAEFIFSEVDRKGISRPRLSDLNELRLLEVLCDYFGYTGGNNEAARNTVFMSLFPPSQTDRSRLLSKLVSMSISTKNIPVLTATGIWMQQLSCTSTYSLELARQLVQDFFVLVPKALSCWQDLPQLAPQFTANFLTTVAEMYGTSETHLFNPPPDTLLEVITRWIAVNPTLCLAALLVDLKLALPMGGILMAAVTPFAGLFRWCVLAPLHYSTTSESRDSDNPQEKLYSQLHLALLESLLECHANDHIVAARDNVLSSQHMAAISEPIIRYVRRLENIGFNGASRATAALEEALNRYGQAIQVSLAVNCIYGNTGELFKQIETLPENQLLRLILNAYRN